METAITIKVRQLKDIYLAPEINPLSPYPLEEEGRSGIEFIYECIQILPQKVIPVIKIVCPSTEIDAESEAKISALIDKHAEKKLKLNQYRLKSLYRTKIGMLTKGFFAFAILMGLAQVIASGIIPVKHELFKNTLVTGLEVFGWVILWHPFEAFIYEPSEIRADNKMIQQLKDARIELVSE